MNITGNTLNRFERPIITWFYSRRQLHQNISVTCSCLNKYNTKKQTKFTTPRNNPIKTLSVATRDLHTSMRRYSNDDEPKVKREIQTKIVTMQSPFTYIAMKFKVFLMKAYFDQEFDEQTFLTGAKQGVVFVSTHLSEGKFSELMDVMTTEGLQAGRELYFKNDELPASLRVDESDFLQMAMSDIGFEYGEGGRKWAFVLVTCFCTAKEAVAKTFGNIDVIARPTRILKYSKKEIHKTLTSKIRFRREYTPGTAASWMVDGLEHSKTPL